MSKASFPGLAAFWSLTVCACCLWRKCTLSLLTNGASLQAQAYAVNANFSGASRHMCSLHASVLYYKYPRKYIGNTQART